MSTHAKHIIEFVITAPEPYGAELAYITRARLTLGVLTQLIAQASQSLVIASPFIQPNSGLDSGPLADALHGALRRGVRVDIVSTGSGLQALATEDLRRITCGRLRLFQPRPNVEDEQHLGSHAKFCIADNQHAYVGSANLTAPGLARHLEMGLLVHGELALQITEFWEFLLRTGFFVEVQTAEQEHQS
jgi:phosphatidylserine/phosphatidylglycerophosphate/cardiolipin synthase-like enzyme